MTMCVQVSVWCVFIFPGYLTSSRIAGSYGNLHLTFWETAKLISKVDVPSYSLASSEGSNFSTSSPTFIFLSFFNSYPSECKVLSHCGFDLHMPRMHMHNEVEHLFTCLLVILCITLGKMSIHIFGHILIRFFVFFLFGGLWVIYIFLIKAPNNF